MNLYEYLKSLGCEAVDTVSGFKGTLAIVSVTTAGGQPKAYILGHQADHSHDTKAAWFDYNRINVGEPVVQNAALAVKDEFLEAINGKYLGYSVLDRITLAEGVCTSAAVNYLGLIQCEIEVCQRTDTHRKTYRDWLDLFRIVRTSDRPALSSGIIYTCLEPELPDKTV